jgi:primosomal protein N' (replication factor Y)
MELNENQNISLKQLENKLQKTVSTAVRDLENQGILHSGFKILEPEVKEKEQTLILPLKNKENILSKIKKNAYAQKEIINFLAEQTTATEKLFFTRSALFSTPSLNALIKKGFVETQTEIIERKTVADFYTKKFEFELTEEQQKATNSILKKLDIFQTFLLFGITGSGKTVVYIEILKKVIEKGKDAIILIPEISLTPQTVSRFRSIFGDTIAILHSKMTDGERYDAWRLMRDGKYKIAIGPRSAIFSPLKNIGLVIVDEEHEWSYKQSDQVPRYHARDFAIYRALLAKCPVVLGSATPSVESFQNAKSGKFELLELKNRPLGAELPKIKIVDLKNEIDARPTTESIIISEELEKAIESRLLKKEQIILFQNKRGYSSFIQCRDCGHIYECPNCSISLVFHKKSGKYKCHFCGHEDFAKHNCQKCSSENLSLRGHGTQRIEEYLNEIFSHAKILRMDQDTTSKKNAHQEILRKFGSKEADILIGTQMITKGLDFPDVTLVGVLNADIGLSIPDFRAAERTFQLISQVAGRAGRASKKGEVFIQSFQPEHYAIETARNHDSESFYNTEFMARESLDYSPFSRMINFRISSENLNELTAVSDILETSIKENLTDFAKILGPAPCPIEKINNFYRYQFIFKINQKSDPNGTKTKHFLKNLRKWILAKYKDFRAIIDTDPVDLI